MHLANEYLVAFRKGVLPKLNTTDLNLTIRPEFYTPYTGRFLKNLDAAVRND